MLGSAGTTTSKDTFKSWELPSSRRGLGVATVGDRLYMLIPAQLPLPATRSQVWSKPCNRTHYKAN